MERSDSLIDFTELVSSVSGEGLEQLAREIGERKGLTVSWSGRGADGGKDLIFTEQLSGPVSKDAVRWLVSCKDKATSGVSVNEADIANIREKLVQHKADGFLLITTTTAGTAAKSMLDSLDKSNGGPHKTLVWDSSRLTSILLEKSNINLIKQFFPRSYEKVKGLSTLSGAIEAFRDQIPDYVYEYVVKLAEIYSEDTLVGNSIWPHDDKSSKIIDLVVKLVLIDNDIENSVEVTEGIEFDAFVAFVNKMYISYPEECEKYLHAVVKNIYDLDIKFNAAKILFELYHLDESESFAVIIRLDPDSIKNLVEDSLFEYISDELMINGPEYEMYQSLDELSSGTTIDLVEFGDYMFDPSDGEKILFSGKYYVDVSYEFDREPMGGGYFPGELSGYIDKHGIHIDVATIDTSSYFMDDEE